MLHVDRVLLLCLSQDQDCPGGCFSPSNSYNGDLAVLRIWDRVLSKDDISRNMLRERPDTETGLVAMYIFDAEGIKESANGDPLALDRTGGHCVCLRRPVCVGMPQVTGPAKPFVRLKAWLDSR